MLRFTRPQAVVSALLLIALACSDNSSSVAPISPSFSRSAAATTHANSNGLSHLVPCTTRPPHFNSALITPAGGVLQVGPNKLVVPPHALDRARVLSGAVLPLEFVNIEFGPAGLQFDVPAHLTLNTAGCGIPPGSSPYIVYVQDGVIQEVIPAVFDALHNKITGDIHHFSGYSVAWADGQ